MYCRGSIGEQVIIIYFSKSDLINKLINILDGLRVCTFWVIYSFMFHHITYYNFCSTEEIKKQLFFYSDTIPNSSSEHLQIDSLARQKHKLHEQDDIYFLALWLCLRFHSFWPVHPNLYANVLGDENNTAQTEPVLTWKHIHKSWVILCWKPNTNTDLSQVDPTWEETAAIMTYIMISAHCCISFMKSSNFLATWIRFEQYAISDSTHLSE